MWHYCKEKNYKSLYIFSTSGFWAYIFTKNYKSLLNRRSALRAATEHIAEELGLKIGTNPKTDDIDFHIIGDVSRIARLPNGYDVKRGRYCIPITIEDMEKGYEWICEKSKKQCQDFVYYNDNYFDISKFDGLSDTIKEIDDLEVDIEVDDKVINTFLPCIKNCLINTPLKGHNQFWVWTTIYLKEMGFTRDAVKKIVKSYLEPRPRTDGLGENDYEHYIIHDELPDSIFATRYYFPSCNRLIRTGFCPGKCDKYKTNGSVLYK